MIDFEMVQANGLTLRVAKAGPQNGEPILFVHGFPESWYSWRHQLRAFGDAGYRAVALDVRGYGGSDQPEKIDAYSMKQMTADIAALAAWLKPGGAITLIGHDWGAPIVWNTALMFPDQVKAVAGLSIPHMPQGSFTILDMTKRLFIDKGLFFYLHYFQEPGRAEAEFEADTAFAIRAFYYGWSGDAPDRFHKAKPASAKMFDEIGEIPETMPSWFSPEDEAYYTAEFERTGWAGALNRYRNFDRDQEVLTALPSQIIKQPSLFIAGARDPALIMVPGDVETRLQESCADLRGCHLIDGAGHWIQQERPEQVSALLLDWAGTV